MSRTRDWNPFARNRSRVSAGSARAPFSRGDHGYVCDETYAADCGAADRAERLSRGVWHLILGDDDECVPVSAVLPGAANREFRGMGYSEGE